MKFTLSWLRRHLKTTASLSEIVDALTDIGLEVERVKNPITTLAAFCVGYVTRVCRHPNADRLHLCYVCTDAGEKQIICGAANVRPGIYVVVVKPGDYVPGLGIHIKTGKIRGVESQGMLASEKEMQLSDQHDKIIELVGMPKVGSQFVDYLALHAADQIDPMIEIAVTPNRPDALGVRGIARDLAARGLGVLKPLPKAALIETKISSVNKVYLTKDVIKAQACAIFAGRIIQGIDNEASPPWLQARMQSIGLRSISTLVDITNLFTYEYNRPLHVFDSDKLCGDLRVRFATDGERLLALNDKNYRLTSDTLVISDDKACQSIAGIIGGKHSGCDEKTANIFLESAYWNRLHIARSGRILGIESDARYRFERGVDPAFTLKGLDLAAALIVELCGGVISQPIVVGAIPNVSRQYRFDYQQVRSLVGMDIAPQRQKAILSALGFKLKDKQVKVPSWRPDITGSIDLVEEVARIASLSQLKAVPLPPLNQARATSSIIKPILTPVQRRINQMRRNIAALGYHECVSYSFIDQPSAGYFGGGDTCLKISNPISTEMSDMRPSLLPGLLQMVKKNQIRGFINIALFEVGTVFYGGMPGEQKMAAAGVLVGNNDHRNPHGALRPVDIYDVKADAQAVLMAIKAPKKLMVVRNVDDYWHPLRSGALSLGIKKPLCCFGEIHPKICAALGIKTTCLAFVINFDNIPCARKKSLPRAGLELSDLQPVVRDFAFVVDAQFEVQMLVHAAQSVDKNLIDEVRVFDLFDGQKAAQQFGSGKKSIAITVIMQPRKNTLTDKKIQQISAKIIKKVNRVTGGVLRQ